MVHSQSPTFAQTSQVFGEAEKRAREAEVKLTYSLMKLQAAMFQKWRGELCDEREMPAVPVEEPTKTTACLVDIGAVVELECVLL